MVMVIILCWCTVLDLGDILMLVIAPEEGYDSSMGPMSKRSSTVPSMINNQSISQFYFLIPKWVGVSWCVAFATLKFFFPPKMVSKLFLYYTFFIKTGLIFILWYNFWLKILLVLVGGCLAPLNYSAPQKSGSNSYGLANYLKSIVSIKYCPNMTRQY